MPQASNWQGHRVFLTGHTGFKGSFFICFSPTWMQKCLASQTELQPFRRCLSRLESMRALHAPLGVILGVSKPLNQLSGKLAPTLLCIWQHSHLFVSLIETQLTRTPRTCSE